MTAQPNAHARRVARRAAERQQAATIRGRNPEPGSYITRANAREILAQLKDHAPACGCLICAPDSQTPCEECQAYLIPEPEQADAC